MKIEFVKYYGTLLATIFVLLLSTSHIAEALVVVEKVGETADVFSKTWFASAGFQFFEVIAGVGLADFLVREKRNKLVIILMSLALVLFFVFNLTGNVLFSLTNMIGKEGREIKWSDVEILDKLQFIRIIFASVPIPLMGIVGVIVLSIFRNDIKEPKKEIKVIKEKKESNPKELKSEKKNPDESGNI